MSRRSQDRPGGVLVARTNITSQMEVVATFVRCKDHPYYRAVRKPRANCLTCYMMYMGKVHDPFAKTICIKTGPEKGRRTTKDAHADSCLACALG